MRVARGDHELARGVRRVELEQVDVRYAELAPERVEAGVDLAVARIVHALEERERRDVQLAARGRDARGKRQ
jgi:hypothetical protein